MMQIFTCMCLVFSSAVPIYLTPAQPSEGSQNGNFSPSESECLQIYEGVLNGIPGTIANKLLMLLICGTQNKDPDSKHISHVSHQQMPLTINSMITRIENSK